MAGKNPKKQENDIVVAIIIIVVVLCVGAYILMSNSNKTPSPNADNKPATTAAQPTPSYKLIETIPQSNGANVDHVHYKYLKDGKPSRKEVFEIMSQVEDKGCDAALCNYYLWTSQDAFNARGDDTGMLASEYAAAHKDSLIGYVNSGQLFFYNGEGDSRGLIYYDSETNKYSVFVGDGNETIELTE